MKDYSASHCIPSRVFGRSSSSQKVVKAVCRELFDASAISPGDHPWRRKKEANQPSLTRWVVAMNVTWTYGREGRKKLAQLGSIARRCCIREVDDVCFLPVRSHGGEQSMIAAARHFQLMIYA